MNGDAAAHLRSFSPSTAVVYICIFSGCDARHVPTWRLLKESMPFGMTITITIIVVTSISATVDWNTLLHQFGKGNYELSTRKLF